MCYVREGTYDKHCVIHWEPCVCDGNVFPFFRLSRARVPGSLRNWSDVDGSELLRAQAVDLHKPTRAPRQGSLFIDVVFGLGCSLRLRSECPGSWCARRRRR